VTARRSREGAVSRPLSVRSLDGRCELSDMRHGVARMGTFYVKCRIENPVDRARSVVLQKVLVDTGSEFSRVPEKSLERINVPREKKDVSFVLANGQQVTRSVGFAIIRLDKYVTVDEVVFAEPGDLLLLAARTLGGLNLTIDPGCRRLVAAGPLPAAPPTSRRLTLTLHPTRRKPRAGECYR